MCSGPPSGIQKLPAPQTTFHLSIPRKTTYWTGHCRLFLRRGHCLRWDLAGSVAAQYSGVFPSWEQECIGGIEKSRSTGSWRPRPPKEGRNCASAMEEGQAAQWKYVAPPLTKDLAHCAVGDQDKALPEAAQLLHAAAFLADWRFKNRPALTAYPQKTCSEDCYRSDVSVTDR
jgi:hypothetical protein